ncbi:MAG: hypothetical protein P8J70_00095 [Glaciecola sp.]|nr:hypothetical protein [Glaciecola sp.]MDG1816661.1 hypothetical protein [Glaciecola sp.]MDG2098066.1 hypothetical protein [Glaciecola sp.]
MYSDEDLNLAVAKGIFTDSSVEQFRHLLSTERNSPAVDKENFKLIGGFNDIFVVIACLLLLFSSLWVVEFTTQSTSVGFLVFSVLAWGLSEIFVKQRKMALPAIVLLVSFIGGVFCFVHELFASEDAMITAIAAGTSFIAAGVHWWRFKVPITVAVATGALIGLIVSVLLSVFPLAQMWLMQALFICGSVAFTFAMYWDSTDTKRITYHSDVAFWLHLLSAPLIIHPIFSSLGILEGTESLLGLALVMCLYVIMSGISIIIDRRAFMVSSLIYVIYAISSIIENYGGVGYSFAITGVLMGAALLLLSAYWQPLRRGLVSKLPLLVRDKVPSVKPQIGI